MSLPVHPKSGPINANAFMTGLFASAAWELWSASAGSFLIVGLSGACVLIALPAGINAAALAGRDYMLRRKLAKAARASTDHGTAREATWEEMTARAMHDPASGNFIGLRGKAPVFAPERAPFSLVEIPPGGMKTIALVIGSILHQARLGKSLFVPDVKMELAPMLVEALRALGIEVWCVNPAMMHLDLCGATELNLYQAVLDACMDKGAFRKDAVKLTFDLADLHLPEPKGESANVYFRNGSRRCIGIAILSQAMLDRARCTPSDAFALLDDPAAFKRRLTMLRYEIERLFPGDPIATFLKAEAANLLDRFKHNEENAASFLEGATQALLAFNQGGRMAGYGRTATVNIADMRRRQVVMFVMSPLSHARDFAPVVSLLNHSLLEIAKREPAGHPIHIVGEEALNYRFADIVSDMETMRGLRISADFYIQSFNGLVRKYGREAAAAIEAYADVRVYAGINSLDRARHVSDMLAEETIRRQDYSFQADVKDINVSSKELGRRLMRPDEVLAMPRWEAWVFVRGLRPAQLALAHYGHVSPWRDQVASNPLEGPPLRGEIAFTIRYPKNASDDAEPEKPVLEGAQAPQSKKAGPLPRVWPVRLRHLLWIPPLAALWGVGLAGSGTPHLRVSASYSFSGAERFYRRCDYVGLHAQSVFPPDGRCPLIAFLPSR